MRTNDRRGSVVILVAVLMVVLLGFGAFAVDVSQMQAYKSELRRTADAAVLAATLQLLHEAQYGQAGQVAQQYVVENPVFGDTAQIVSVEYGRHNGSAFTPLSCNPACGSDSIRSSNAIRLSLRGTGAFYLAQLLGQTQYTLDAQATAWLPVTATSCAAPWAVTRAVWDLHFPGGAPSPTSLRNMPLTGSPKVFTVKRHDPIPAGTFDEWFGAINLPQYGLPQPLSSALGYAQNIVSLNGCIHLGAGDVVQGKLSGLDVETVIGVSGIGGLANLCASLPGGACYGVGGQVGVAVRVPIVDSLTTPGIPCLTDPLFIPDDQLMPGSRAVCFSVVEVGTFVVTRATVGTGEAGNVIAVYAGTDTVGPARGYAQRPILVQ